MVGFIIGYYCDNCLTSDIINIYFSATRSEGGLTRSSFSSTTIYLVPPSVKVSIYSFLNPMFFCLLKPFINGCGLTNKLVDSVVLANGPVNTFLLENISIVATK